MMDFQVSILNIFFCFVLFIIYLPRNVFRIMRKKLLYYENLLNSKSEEIV